MGCLKLSYYEQENALEVNPNFLENALEQKSGKLEKRLSSYRYGFNGMEKDDELKGSGNSYTSEFRNYDPRIARWLSMDPIVHSSYSPYSAFDNNPIYFNDPKGANSEAVVDKEKKTIDVTVTFHTSKESPEKLKELYSNSDATTKVDPNFVQDFEWVQKFEGGFNGAWGEGNQVEIDGETWTVNYIAKVVIHDTHKEALDAFKEDPSSNWIFAIDNSRYYSWYSAEKSQLQYNIHSANYSTSAHEGGHAMGLPHLRTGQSIMSSTNGSDRVLTSQDVRLSVLGMIEVAKMSTDLVVTVHTYTQLETDSDFVGFPLLAQF